MPTPYSPEITKFIEEEMSSGAYKNEAALIEEALGVLRELKLSHAELKQQIQQSLENEEAGRVAAFDIQEILRELESELDETGQPST